MCGLWCVTSFFFCSHSRVVDPLKKISCRKRVWRHITFFRVYLFMALVEERERKWVSCLFVKKKRATCPKLLPLLFYMGTHTHFCVRSKKEKILIFRNKMKLSLAILGLVQAGIPQREQVNHHLEAWFLHGVWKFWTWRALSNPNLNLSSGPKRLKLSQFIITNLMNKLWKFQSFLSNRQGVIENWNFSAKKAKTGQNSSRRNHLSQMKSSARLSMMAWRWWAKMSTEHLMI